MKMKMRLVLILLMVLGVGVFLAGRVLAETKAPWCCVPNSGNNCVDSDSYEGCQTGYTAKTTSACSTISGCAQYSSATTTACETVCVPSASCSKTISGSCSKSGDVCCASSSSGGGNTGIGGGTGGGTGVDIPTDTGLPTNSGLVKGILVNVLNWLLSIIGIIAIIGFIISGFQYFMTGVDEKSVEKAKKTATASVIGIIIALSGYVVIAAVEKILKGTNF